MVKPEAGFANHSLVVAAQQQTVKAKAASSEQMKKRQKEEDICECVFVGHTVTDAPLVLRVLK